MVSNIEKLDVDKIPNSTFFNEGKIIGLKEKTEKKMTDDEIMRFNEEIMAKVNKREVQPLETEKKDVLNGLPPAISLDELLMKPSPKTEKKEVKCINCEYSQHITNDNCFKCENLSRFKSKIKEKKEIKYTDCIGICGFCEIKNTCDNPKRLKQTEKKEDIIPLIAKIITKETTEEYCSSERIAGLIYDKLKDSDSKNTVALTFHRKRGASLTDESPDESPDDSPDLKLSESTCDEEAWECPICHKTVFVGYTTHRHCLDNLISKVNKMLEKTNKGIEMISEEPLEIIWSVIEVSKFEMSTPSVNI